MAGKRVPRISLQQNDHFNVIFPRIFTSAFVAKMYAFPLYSTRPADLIH
jgi:hypothetical protein